MTREVCPLALALISACGRFGFAELEDDGDSGATPPQVRSTLTLDRFTPATALFDFPLLVVLDDTRADRAKLRPDAGDLTFRDTSGTALAHEIEQVGTPGGPPLIAWVRVPVFAGTTTLEVLYGGSVASPVAATWSADYVAVWHLSDRDTVKDSAGTHDGVPVGSQADAGFIGTGRAFDADIGEYVRVPSGNMVMLSAMTASGWIRPLRHSPSPTGFHAIVTRQHGNSTSDDFYVGVSNSDVACVLLATDTTFDSIGGPAVTFGTWMHIAATWALGDTRLYLDGTEVGAKTIPGSLLHVDDYPIFIGANRNNLSGTVPPDVADDDYTDGQIDEVRIERVARSASWIAADVASMRDQIISYGQPEPTN